VGFGGGGCGQERALAQRVAEEQRCAVVQVISVRTCSAAGLAAG
jgi:hypothetical protein